MTLYCAYAGGTKAKADDISAWVGEPFDGFLAYTEGWDPNNWEGLRPIVVTDRPGALGATGRRLTWSIMFIPDVDHNNIQQGVNWYREVARGERNALYDQMGRDLMIYHDRIGDTGPIYVRSIWEIPGDWFAWNVAAVQDVNAYIGAWRQFATAIRAGRPRIKVVWDFNSDRGEIEYLYPGDAYVDVISQDIYWIHDLQGTDPVAAFRYSRYGINPFGGNPYSWPLQRHFDWCKGKRKPMAISEFAVKLRDRPFQLDSTTWFQEFFNFVDYANADPDVGMAYVNWWSNAEAGVGTETAGSNGFRDEAGEPHLTNVRNMWRARLPGTILGTGDNPPPPPPPPPDPDPTYPAVTTTFGTGPDSLVLRISQQPYLSVSAQYRVLIDAVQYGGTFTASATRVSGLTDTLTLLGTFSAGQHAVRVEFLNDAYGGSASLDRNLYLIAATFNSVNIPAAPKDILGANEAAVFSFTKGGVIVLPPPAVTARTLFTRTRTPLVSGRRPLGQAPGNVVAAQVSDINQATLTVGSGADVLVLRMTQDPYNGSAQYTVSVDGVQIGGVLTAVAVRNGGYQDTVSVRGNWSSGQHTVAVNFINNTV